MRERIAKVLIITGVLIVWTYFGLAWLLDWWWI